MTRDPSTIDRDARFQSPSHRSGDTRAGILGEYFDAQCDAEEGVIVLRRFAVKED
jgi:hypothetical protein